MPALGLFKCHVVNVNIWRKITHKPKKVNIYICSKVWYSEMSNTRTQSHIYTNVIILKNFHCNIIRKKISNLRVEHKKMILWLENLNLSFGSYFSNVSQTCFL